MICCCPKQVETEVTVKVGAEWVEGVSVPWLLQRLLERKILQVRFGHV